MPGDQFDWEPTRTLNKTIPNRAKRIKALGNAVVPQIIEYIGNLLWQFHVMEISNERR